MSNRHIEDVTIKLILERERLAGRWAVGTRNRATLADILGDLLIEVKAFGGTAGGSDLWLSPDKCRRALTTRAASTSSPLIESGVLCRGSSISTVSRSPRSLIVAARSVVSKSRVQRPCTTRSWTAPQGERVELRSGDARSRQCTRWTFARRGRD